jgi:hypothetical protein
MSQETLKQNEFGPVFDHATVSTPTGRETVDLVFGTEPHAVEQNAMFAKVGEKYLPFCGHRRQIKISLDTTNVVSPGRDGDVIAAKGNAYIYIDGSLVYGFVFTDPLNALLDVRAAIIELSNLTFMHRGWSREAIAEVLVGRKVLYRDQPAVVKSFQGQTGEVTLEPDGIDGFTVPSYVTAIIDEALAKDDNPSVDILSPEIWWYRD